MEDQALECRGDESEVQAEVELTKQSCVEGGLFWGKCRGCTSSFFFLGASDAAQV